MEPCGVLLGSRGVFLAEGGVGPGGQGGGRVVRGLFTEGGEGLPGQGLVIAGGREGGRESGEGVSV